MVVPWSMLPKYGLSPQVRGTRGQPAVAQIHVRFIPAGAGNTVMVCLFKLLPAVYPRRCGEHPIATGTTPATTGLSPQVRGTPAVKTSFQSSLRFIPAGAGNTLVRMAQAAASAVYPRRCGEHVSVSSLMGQTLGLSPQVRGTRAGLALVVLGVRFIPAGAGNTPAPVPRCAAGPVYPRRCGEHDRSIPAIQFRNGLSPQVRGTPDSIKPGENWHRFIPAGAGNTLRVPRRCTEAPVYPRRCGEHMEGDFGPWLYFGLSPQVRGTRGLAALANA